MEVKFTVTTKFGDIELKFGSEEERIAVNQLILDEIFDFENYEEFKKILKPKTETQVEPKKEMIAQPASEAQKNYMRKLFINFNPNITMPEAIELINNWKLEHGVPVTRGKNG